MRRLNLCGLLGLAVLATFAVCSQADALTALKTYKEVFISVVVTPSPAPVGWLAPKKSAYPDPAPAAVQIASSGTAWDVAPGGPFELAQATAQPPPVPVQFVAKADPNAQYLHIVPHTPPAGYLAAPYGTTVFPCAFEVYTYYTNSYKLQDWGYGTTKTGGANSGTFPVENYPAVSYLSWAVPDFSPTFTPYWNQGPAGEQTWIGTVKVRSMQCCCAWRTAPVQVCSPAGPWFQYGVNVGEKSGTAHDK